MSGHLLPETRRPLEALARTGPSPLVDVPLRLEDPDRAEELANRAVGVATGAAPGDLAGPAAESGELVAVGRAVCDPGGRIGDRAQAEDARPALSVLPPE